MWARIEEDFFFLELECFTIWQSQENFQWSLFKNDFVVAISPDKKKKKKSIPQEYYNYKWMKVKNK